MAKPKPKKQGIKTLNDIDKLQKSIEWYDTVQIKNITYELIEELRRLLKENETLAGKIHNYTCSEKVEELQDTPLILQRYIDLFNAIPDAVFVHTLHPNEPPGKFIEVNRVACERLGYTREELLNMSYINIDDKDSSTDLKPIIEKIIKREPCTFRQVHVSKNGKKIPVEIHAKPIQIGGKPATISIVTDIRDRVASIERQEKLLHIIESAPIGIAMVNREGALVDCNRHFEKIVGYTREVLLELSYKKLTFQEDLKQEIPLIKKLWKKEISDYRIEKRYIKKNGDIKWVEVSCSLLERPGMRTEYAFAFVQDITERVNTRKKLEESEKKLKYAEKIAKIGYFEIDIKSKTCKCSDEIYEIFGITPEEVLDVQSMDNFTRFIHDTDKEKVINSFFRGIHAAEPMQLNFRIKRKDKKTRVIQSRTEVILHDNQEPVSVFGTIQDITDQEKARRLLQQQNRKLTGLNDTKDKLFSIISHDLKAPYNNLLGFTELLYRKIKSGDLAKIEEYAYYINTSARQGYELLQRLLEWSVTQTGKIEISKEDIFPFKIVNEEIESLKISAVKKDIIIQNELDQELTIYSDPNVFRIITRNLLSNAIKFTPAGGQIDISAVRTPDKTYIGIRDTGVGLTEQEIARLFKLKKTDTRGTAGEKGTGLGLLICKELVEKAGGKITVESHKGLGSTFMITLPSKGIE
ncbi:MAG: PAS domain S-box protein [Bacteroidales bacterium]